MMWLIWLMWAPSETPAVVVSYSTLERGMVIEARINGKGPYKFILDTGAAMTVISPNVAQQLKLKPSGAIKLVGVAGKPMQASLTELSEIAVDRAKARRMEVAIQPILHLNKAGVIGLLGSDFLSRFEMSLNPARKTLTLKLPEDPNKKKTKPKLDPFQKSIQAVLADPTSAYSQFNDLTTRINALTEQEDQTARTMLQTELDKITQEIDRLHRHLLQTPPKTLTGAQRNNLQKFLICHPHFKKTTKATSMYLQNESNEAETKTWRQAIAQFTCGNS